MENNKYTKFKNIYLIVISIIIVLSIIAGCYMHLSKGGFNIGKKNSGKSGNASSEVIKIDKGFSEIEIDVDIADLTFEYGDKYCVEYDYKDYNPPKVNVDGNTLQISEKAGVKNFNTTDADCSITIIIPKGTVLEDISIKLDCGNIEFSDLQCEDLTISADLGNVELSNITCKDLSVDADCGNIEFDNSTMDKVTASADMGAITFTKVTFTDGDMTADMGAIEVSGDFNSLKANCDLGAIEIETDKNVNDIDLDLNASLGSITVNGKTWH